MGDADYISVGQKLPRIAAVQPMADGHVSVAWVDGGSQVVDLRPAILSHRAFIELRDDHALFLQVKVSSTGDSLVWPNGAELAAVWIEELGPATIDNAEFREAMDSLRLSLDGMAMRLQVSRRLIADYRKDKPIPPAVGLAVRYLVERQRRAG